MSTSEIFTNRLNQKPTLFKFEYFKEVDVLVILISLILIILIIALVCCSILEVDYELGMIISR